MIIGFIMLNIFKCRRTWRFSLAIAIGSAVAAPVFAQVPADPFNYSREIVFERDPVTGEIVAEVLQPQNPQLCLRTEYTYDTYGNRRTTTQRHCAGASGTAVVDTRLLIADHVNIGSTPPGLAPTVVTNQEGHVEYRQFDTRYGGVSRLEDADGLVTGIAYDDFGRKTFEVRPDGNRTAWVYRLCSAVGGSEPCPGDTSSTGGAVLAYLVRATPQNASGETNGPISTVYFDTEGREVRAETQVYALDGMRNSVTLRQYDALGRLVRQTGPYFEGDTPAEWVERMHDVLGRVIEETRPNPNAPNGLARATTTYNGRVVTQTNALDQTLTKEHDEYGHVMRVTDAQGNQISYQNDAFGNLVIVRDPLGNLTTISYDLRGRKVAMTDPNMGAWTYEVDVLGQLVKQTSPKTLVTTQTYDRLGRMTRRLESDLDSRWYFDRTAATTPCGKSTGVLCEATTSTGYRRLNAYDNLRRLTQTSTTLADGANGVYVSKVDYDANGHVAQQIWPTGLAVQNVYNAQGVLLELRNAASNALYWQRLENNARGQFVRVLTGNGLVSRNTWQPETGTLTALHVGPSASVGSTVGQGYFYNVINGLTSRNDAIAGLTESFGYDRLNRLTSQAVFSPSSNRQVSYHYDALGNMAYNSEVGTYDYAPAAGTPGPQRPHAVKRITGQAGKLTNPTYTYDAHGNIERVAGANGVSRTHAWTSFDMPQSLTLSERGVSSVFLYGPEHQRIRQVITRDGRERTVQYLHPDNEGSLYFERELQGTGGVATNRHFLSAEKGAFLQIETPGDLQTNPIATNLVGLQLRYWHKDHLGSIAAITDGNGSVMERLAYEPFGKRRYASGQHDRTGEIDAVTTKRGFTGHEHLDEVDFVHMNGRIYDPDLARFLSPDPTVPYLHHLQSFNRYSYTRNNPLNLVDPNGFEDTASGDIPGTAEAPPATLGNNLGDAAVNAAIAKGNGKSPTQQADNKGPKAQAATPEEEDYRADQRAYQKRKQDKFDDVKQFLKDNAKDAAIEAAQMSALGKALGLLGAVGKSLFGKKGAAATEEAIVTNLSRVELDKAVTAKKAEKTAAATRAENIAKGIPESQLGPSGEPKIHVVDHGGKRKTAKDAARSEVGKGGSTTNHVSPAVGEDHYHGVTQSDKKSRVHHEYKN